MRLLFVLPSATWWARAWLTCGASGLACWNAWLGRKFCGPLMNYRCMNVTD